MSQSPSLPVSQSPSLLSPESKDRKADPSTYSVFHVTPKLSFSRIDSTDSASGGAATFLSGMNTGASGGWGQHWTNQWQTFLEANILNTNLESANTKTISSSSRALGGFGFGVTDQVSDRFEVTGSVGVQQKLFIRAVSLTTLTVDQPNVPYVGFRAHYDLVGMEPLSLGVAIGGVYFFPTNVGSYSINSGQGYYGEVFLMHDMKTMRLFGGLAYKQDTQGSSIAKQSSSEMSLEIGLSWALGR